MKNISGGLIFGIIMTYLIFFMCGYLMGSIDTHINYCNSKYSNKLKQNKDSYVKWDRKKGCIYYKIEK